MFKKIITQLMLLIDSGKMLKTPFKWLYAFFAALMFVPVIALIVCVIRYWDDFISFLGDSFWSIFVTMFIAILFAYALVVIALCLYQFWINRKHNLDSAVKTGSRIFAIPLVAHINQCIGEANSIFLVVTCSCAAVLAYVALMLTGGVDFYSDFNFLKYLLFAIAGIVVIGVLAYLNLLLVRFVSEKMRIWAGLGNDVRDIRNGVKVEDVNEEEKAEISYAMPKLSKKEKKISIVAIVADVVVSLIIALIIIAPVWSAMGRSIYKPLSDNTIGKVCDKSYGFGSFYDSVRLLTETKDENTYGEITYGRLFNYFNDYYDNNSIQSKLQTEALEAFEKTYHKPLLDSLEKEKAKWEEYIQKNDPDRYLKVTAVTGNYHHYSGYYYYDNPQWYYRTTIIDNRVVDARVSVGVVDSYGRADDRFDFSYSLKEIKENHDDASARYTSVVDNSSFWSSHKMIVKVLSVTLNDGTVIKSNSSSVPSVVKKYLSDPSEENEVAFIRDCIDGNYPDKEQVVEEYIQNAIRERDELCYAFLKEE